MANLCSFELHARVNNLANESSLLELKRRFGLTTEEKNFFVNLPEDGFSVRDMYLDEYVFTKRTYVMHVSGECKWSVAGPLLDELQAFCQQHPDVEIEIYSAEMGVGFMEHFFIKNGKLVENECRDALEFHVNDIMEDEDGELDYIFENKLCRESCCTKDNYQSFADDEGYVRLGGFKEWNFEF